MLDGCLVCGRRRSFAKWSSCSSSNDDDDDDNDISRFGGERGAELLRGYGGERSLEGLREGGDWRRGGIRGKGEVGGGEGERMDVGVGLDVGVTKGSESDVRSVCYCWTGMVRRWKTGDCRRV